MSAVEVYRKTRKPEDLLWNSYVCRPVGAVLVDWLKDTRVSPNQVTLASLVVAGVAAALLVAWPGYAGLLVAIVVYEFSYVLDCVDGMLARWRGVASKSGHLLDFLMDEIKAFALLAAAAFRLAEEHAEPRYLWVGLFGLVALATGTALTTFLRRPEISGSTADKPETRKTGPLVLPITAAKFLVHYPSYIWLCAALGHLEWYLLPYVGIHTLYAGGTLGHIALRFGRAER